MTAGGHRPPLQWDPSAIPALSTCLSPLSTKICPTEEEGAEKAICWSVPMGASSHIFAGRRVPFGYDALAADKGKGFNLMSKEGKVIRILLVEEEALIRAALQKLLESWSGFEVIGEASTKDETLELIHHLDPDVILLSLPGGDDADLEIVQDLARAAGRARLLALMGQCEPPVRIRVVRMGARGVVQKKKSPNELRRAIQKICEGEEIWLDRTSLASLIMQVGESLVDEHTREESRFALLTDREREVVAFVVKGFKNKDVGERLFISETTVRHHLTTIFNKLSVSSRFELIAYLHRHPFSGSEGTHSRR